MNYPLLIIVFIAAYLIGSINSSIIVSRIYGSDIRKHGSGNAGATNTLRTYGKKAAALVTVFDILKAVVALLIGKIANIDNYVPIGYLSASLGVILGHNFPVFFGFRGGKGVLVSITSIMFIDYRIGLIIALISILIMALTKYVSLGSVTGAILFPVLVALFNVLSESKTEGFAVYMTFALVIGLLCVYMHRKNIVKLLNGTESKLGQKAK